MGERDEERRFSLFRRKSTKRDLSGSKNYSGAIPIGARLATANERSATLPSQSSAQGASNTMMTQSPSGGLFSKIKRKFRLRSSRGKYDLKDYDRPQRIRRKSDDPLRSDEQSETTNLARVTSSVKTPRRSQNDKENVILIRKDKCVSVICQDANGGAEVIFSNMSSTEDNSDSISEQWGEGGEEDPYATINSVKEEIKEKFSPNPQDKSDVVSKKERDRARAKELLQYSVASSNNASAATTPNGISNGNPSKMECVNVEDLYAKINSKSKMRNSDAKTSTDVHDFQQQEQKCEILNKFVEAQIRCRQEHEYETLEDVRMRASELFDQSDLSLPNSPVEDGDVGKSSGLDTSDGSGEFEIEPDYETLEEVRQRVSVSLSSPIPNGEGVSSLDETEEGSSSHQTSHNDPPTPSSSTSKTSTNLLETPSTASTSAASPSKSPLAPLAQSIDTDITTDNNTNESSASPDNDCIYDNPNVILRKQFFRHSLHANLSPHHRQNFTLLDASPAAKKSTAEEEELIQKLSSQLAPPLPLRMYQKEEATGICKGIRSGSGSRHSWSAHSSTTKFWDMSGSWHAGMEGTPSTNELVAEEGAQKSGMMRSKSQEAFDELKEEGEDVLEFNNGRIISDSNASEGVSPIVITIETVVEAKERVALITPDNLSLDYDFEETNSPGDSTDIEKVCKVIEMIESQTPEGAELYDATSSSLENCNAAIIAADSDSIPIVHNQNENVETVSCCGNVNIKTDQPNAKIPIALAYNPSQRLVDHSLNEQSQGCEKDEESSCNTQLNHQPQFDNVGCGQMVSCTEDAQTKCFPSTGDSIQSSIDSTSTDDSLSSGEKRENEACNCNERSLSGVCLRDKKNISGMGTNEWKVKRKSGPNASATQDIVEISMAFEHGEFLSGFTEQYKAEEDLEEEEEHIFRGFSEVGEPEERGTLQSMSVAGSIPCRANTDLSEKIIDVDDKKFAPICQCEDFEDCSCVCADGCDQKCELINPNEHNTVNTQKLLNHSDKKNIAEIPCKEAQETSSDNAYHKSDYLVNAVDETDSPAGIHNVTESRRQFVNSNIDKDISKKKRKSPAFDAMLSGCNSNFSNDMQSGPSCAISSNSKCQVPCEILWENLIGPITYKPVHLPLLSQSSRQCKTSQVISSHQDGNQKLFLHMLRLLENVINGFCQQWMAIDLSYILVGVFKWSRCFHLPLSELAIVERKLKRLVTCERDAIMSKWNVNLNKFYEKRREKHQEDIDSIYQKIRDVLFISEGLPTFQSVRSDLLGSFFLEYEVKRPHFLSKIFEQEVLRISQEDLMLWKQTLSCDEWTDSRSVGADPSSSLNTGSGQLVSDQCSCCVSSNENQNMAMQMITLDSSCQLSPHRDISDGFSASFASMSASASDSSAAEHEAHGQGNYASSPRRRRSGILNEFLNLCDSVGNEEDASDLEDEEETIQTYISSVTYSVDTEHADIVSVYDDVAVHSLCRVFHGELSYTSRLRKPRAHKDKDAGLSDCCGKQSHLSNSNWQEMDLLMRKLIPPISPRLDFQFLLRTYAEFKFFILKERQRRKNSRCFGRHCFQIETDDGPRCCLKEEVVFMKLIRDELQHFANVIRRSSASESLFVEDREVSFALTRLLSLTLTSLARVKYPGRKLSTSLSRPSSQPANENQKLEAVASSNVTPSCDSGSTNTCSIIVENDVSFTPTMPLDSGMTAESSIETMVVVGNADDGADVIDENSDDDDYKNDDGLYKWCIPPREKAEFHIENYRSFRAGCMWSDLDIWQSPDAFLDDPNILDRKMGSSFCVDRDTNATMHSHSTWGHYEEPKPLQERDDFLESMQQLQMKAWYWGPLSYEQAESVLRNHEDGSFLVRDSSDRKYLLSLSFKSLGGVYHTRIEHAKGLFSFWSQPDSHGKARICEFIEKSVQNSHDGKFLYFLSPNNYGSPPLPIRLLNPVSRNATIPSLKHLSRFVIRQHVRRDLLEFLPVPRMVIGYLRLKQFYVEFRDKGRWPMEGSANTNTNTL